VRPVYITRLSKFLPNEPVSNNEIEEIIGKISDRTSKAQALVLRKNGIKTRYYAFRDGKSTHSNAQLAAIAVEALFDEKFPIEKLQVLSAATSSPEQLLPSHASMVHGAIGSHPMEITSSTGACCTGLQALKYAFMCVGSGQSDVAVSCGSEKLSTWMHASRFQAEADNIDQLNENPIIAFEKDFLRFMLSDGAGAALLQDEPNGEGLSLKIEWIEIKSYANQLPSCMYAGAIKNEDDTLTGWNELDVSDWTEKSVFSYKQDTRLLGENIIGLGGEFLSELKVKYGLSADGIDYYLPHMSSEYFKKEMIECQKKIGMEIPDEKWFYNLTKVGNIGSASAYVMLEELFYSGRLKKGQQILVMVPESARFTYAHMYLTVV
jgi:3-oxoacyl-[acyl-carrier-protein] synthase III